MRRHGPTPPTRSGRAGDPDLPSLFELERFSATSLRQWIMAAGRLGTVHRALYFELEARTTRVDGGP
jgi:hypothetical protein